MDRGLVIGLSVIALGAVGTPLLIRWGRRVSRNPAAHPVGRYVWPGLKWTLALLGAYVLIGMGIDGLWRREVNIGLAFIVYLVYQTVAYVHRRFTTH